ncbi:DDHD domain-containing protein [Radiomyces spectabilis]|uniref:DDHD domain-containing protein n=1 Tax=Radiomyces spectabilis TaxID=64574 RepID=UPI00222009A0|nr:DDHD domain-containing protein [Radiomyces spectabilis]KAI8376523.1 DDHD domain-containing protein [Radiomyces spectabilis]
MGVDVNILRKTLKTAYPTAIASTATPQRSNGIQLLPIMWRQEIKFGMASDDEEGVETDLGTLGVDDGCPTLDELTLDGVPNLRTIVSDVLMDIPLYMTPKYRDQMTAILIREINRVYRLFVQRNPGFLERDGKVTIFGHSLGSMLAFDMLSMQPAGPIDPKSALSPATTDSSTRGNANDKKIVPLIFPVQNFFAVGSPLGVILLLKGHNIASRKSMGVGLSSFNESVSTPSSHITYCYPAVENLYNIFHKSDPVAYRLEPLIARQYSAKLKPEPVPYIKGGLKSVIDAGFNVGSGIANRAGAMYESFKMGLTTNLFMRGLGLSRQQIYEDMHPSSDNDDDPAPYSIGARKLRMLNVTGRVDYCLQEGFLENPYLNAFNAHMQYWQDLDVAAFLVREIYR